MAGDLGSPEAFGWIMLIRVAYGVPISRSVCAVA